MSQLAPGTIVAGKYRIEGLAGKGGMGMVYRAIEAGLERPVALKLIAAVYANDDDFRARFQREARIAASIDHPNVVPVFDAGEFEGQLYLTMRYVDGTDLLQLIARDGPLDATRAVRIVSGVAAALDAAHSRGLVHRDIKPGNVLLDANEHVYLTDFGLTKPEAQAGMTQTGQVIGTPDYLAPEQVQGKEATPRSDVYALGCVLYHALTRSPPFERPSDTARLLAHLNDPPPRLPPGSPPALDGVVQQALAKDPGQRFASAGELAASANAAVGGAGAQPAPASGSHAPPGAAKREGPSKATKLVAGIGLPVVVVIGLIAAALAAAGVFESDDDGDGAGARAQPTATATATADATAAPTAAPTGNPRIVASIDVGGSPDGIAVGEGGVFVVDSENSTLARIDASKDAVAGEPVAAGDGTDSVTAARGVVWTTSQRDSSVLRFEARPDPIAAGRIDVGRAPEGISLGKQLVWVAESGSDTVQRIDRASAEKTGGPIGVGDGPIGIFVGDGTVWVTNSKEDTVTRIDPATSELIGGPIAVGDDPRDVVEAGGSAWVVNAGDDTVTRLDAKSGEVVGEPIRVGQGPVKVAFGEGFIWVTNRGANTLSRIDPANGRVVGNPLPVGTRPVGVVAGLGAIWVANSGDGTVTKIELQ